MVILYISVSLSDTKYTVNRRDKEVVYEEFPLGDVNIESNPSYGVPPPDHVKIQSNPSYGVPSQLTASIANPQVVEAKGQSTEVKADTDYL